MRKNTTNYMELCYFCSSGTCTISSGTGWTLCEDASPGSNTCALGGGNDCSDLGEGG